MKEFDVTDKKKKKKLLIKIVSFFLTHTKKMTFEIYAIVSSQVDITSILYS